MQSGAFWDTILRSRYSGILILTSCASTNLIASGWFFRNSYLYTVMITIFFFGGGGSFYPSNTLDRTLMGTQIPIRSGRQVFTHEPLAREIRRLLPHYDVKFDLPSFTNQLLIVSSITWSQHSSNTQSQQVYWLLNNHREVCLMLKFLWGISSIMRAHVFPMGIRKKYSCLPFTQTLVNSRRAFTQTKIDFPWICFIHLLLFYPWLLEPLVNSK